MERAPVGGMGGAEPLGHEGLDGLADQLAGQVADELLRLSVGHEDPAPVVDQDERGGRGLDGQLELLFRAPARAQILADAERPDDVPRRIAQRDDRPPDQLPAAPGEEPALVAGRAALQQRLELAPRPGLILLRDDEATRKLGCVALAPPAAAQDATRDEFWPEVDGYLSLGERSRLFLLATVARNEGFAEGMLGAHVDFFLKPLSRPWLRESPDVFKRRYLAFRAGYRYAWDLNDTASYQEHRALFELTPRVPLPGLFLFINRNRLDLRRVNGEWSWRYRNRFRLERDVSLGSRPATAYAMVELFYDSRYDEWNRERYFFGVEWPLGRTPILDTYYCRQNDSRSSTAHVNAYGLALNLFF